VSILVNTGVIPTSWEEYDLQEGLLNFLVVFEMLFFAIAHYFVFSHKPYIDPAAAQVPCIATCLRMLDIRDVAGDLKEHFVDPLPRPRFRRTGVGPSQPSSEGTIVTINAEDAPLLRNKQGPDVPNGVCANGGHLAVKGGMEIEKSALSSLSYDVLTYKELDSRTAYGVRARMIANAGWEVTEEEDEGTETSQSATSSERNSGGTTPTEKSLSPVRMNHMARSSKD
jgi:hypothetical protein